MQRIFSNHGGLAAALLALSLVTTISFAGCGSDGPTAPENRPADAGDTFNGDEDGNRAKNDANRMEDGR
jgi:predicted small lipoprotein YifL